MRLISLSGPVCAGKTTLAMHLSGRLGGVVLTTRALIAERAGAAPSALSRRRLQELGAALDAAEGGEWVARAVHKLSGSNALIVVDSVRTPEQLAAVGRLGTMQHVHLAAPHHILERRYAERSAARSDLEFPSFAAVREDRTEAQIERLARFADLVLDTGEHDAAAVVEQVVRVADF